MNNNNNSNNNNNNDHELLSSIIHATLCNIIEWKGLSKEVIGRRGAAITCLYYENFNNINNDINNDILPYSFRLMFYNINKNANISLDTSLLSIDITDQDLKFTFDNDDNATANLYGDKSDTYWSIQFETYKEADIFARYLAITRGYMKQLEYIYIKQSEIERHQHEIIRKLESEKASRSKNKLSKYQKELETLAQSIFINWPITYIDLSATSSNDISNQNKDVMRVEYGDSVKIRYNIHLLQDSIIMSNNEPIFHLGIGDKVASIGVSNDGYRSEGNADEFIIGDGTHMKGLEQGLLDMEPKTRRFMIIPPHFVPTESGVNTNILKNVPQNSTLLIDCALISITKQANVEIHNEIHSVSYETEHLTNIHNELRSLKQLLGNVITSHDTSTTTTNTKRIDEKQLSKWVKERQEREKELKLENKGLNLKISQAEKVYHDNRRLKEQLRQLEEYNKQQRIDIVKDTMTKSYEGLVDNFQRFFLDQDVFQQFVKSNDDTKLKAIDQIIKHTLKSVTKSILLQSQSNTINHTTNTTNHRTNTTTHKTNKPHKQHKQNKIHSSATNNSQHNSTNADITNSNLNNVNNNNNSTNEKEEDNTESEEKNDLKARMARLSNAAGFGAYAKLLPNNNA